MLVFFLQLQPVPYIMPIVAPKGLLVRARRAAENEWRSSPRLCTALARWVLNFQEQASRRQRLPRVGYIGSALT